VYLLTNEIILRKDFLLIVENSHFKAPDQTLVRACSLTFVAGARKLTPTTAAEEGRHEVVDLEDDHDVALVGAKDTLGAEKSRGAGTWRPARRAVVTS
jgi:hypothetical protein